MMYMTYMTLNFGRTIQYNSKMKKIFLYFLHHFYKNSIFNPFSDPIEYSPLKFFFAYTMWEYTLLCPRKLKKKPIWFLDSLAGFLALGHIFTTVQVKIRIPTNVWD